MTIRPAARAAIATLLFAAAAAAQRPVFDPDDFVEPAQLGGRPFFVSRLVVGASTSSVDRYRPLRQNVAFVHVANSLYWRRLQFDYKHSEVRGEEHGPLRVTRCDCPDPIYFPTPPPRDAIPAAPPPSARDVVQAAFYVPAGGAGQIPVSFRFRLSYARQKIETVVMSGPVGSATSRLSGVEQSLDFDTDLWLPIRRRKVFGTLHVARTERTGTADDRTQTEVVYTGRFPGIALDPIILRATLGVGAVSNRGGAAINAVNPALEAFWRSPSSGVNVHLIYSPVTIRSGAEGWKTFHQIAILADKGFAWRPRRAGSHDALAGDQ